jgi:anti-sigma factor RsiW
MSADSHRPDDVLRRLLGPAEPELSCEQCFDELDRYVEVELEDGAAQADELLPGMRAHLEGCRACDEEHRSLRALVRADDEATHTD